MPQKNMTSSLKILAALGETPYQIFHEIMNLLITFYCLKQKLCEKIFFFVNNKNFVNS